MEENAQNTQSTQEMSVKDLAEGIVDPTVETTIAVSQLLKDLEETGMQPITILGVAINLLAQSYCKHWNNKVPAEGSDYRVGQFVVSIYPALSKAAMNKIRREHKAAKSKES